MTVGLYKITNTVNGKYYIGSSNNIKRRWSNHKNMLKYGRHDNCHLQASFNKHTVDAFVYEIIKEFPIGTEQSVILEAEQAVLDSLTPEDWLKNVFNISREVNNKIITEETKRRLSEIHKKKWTDPKHREYMEQFFCQKGIPLSEEHKRKISETLKGRKYSEESLIKRSATRTGQSISKEARDALYKRMSGKGVRQKNNKGKYFAYIPYNKKSIYLGRHHTYKEALQARLDAEQKYWWSVEDGSDITSTGAA